MTALANDSTPAARPRLDSVDLLRGLVMVIMALDHVRDFLHIENRFYAPDDVDRTTPLLFFTRWITHYCAPTFVFLAGASAWLWASRGRSKLELTRFLVSRGLWLVLVELTLVEIAWTFNFSYTDLSLQVIWAIGWSMVALGMLVLLPLATTGLVGVAMIAGHDLLDGIGAKRLFVGGAFAPDATWRDWVWSILHVQNRPVVYPLIPWIGVMATGFAFGPILKRPPEDRRRLLLRLGITLTVGFVLLRAMNRYGDPHPWSRYPDAVHTCLAFLRVSKYPPSLSFLLMTLGPAITFLAVADQARNAVTRFFVVFGRVPFLFYIAHLYVVHALAIGLTAVTHQAPPAALFVGWWRFPKDFGVGLGAVYVAWAGVVVLLYPACRSFASLKARRRDAWLSYL